MGPDGVAPLGGVRVIEVGEYVAGPFAALMLADLGADVVKVERPGRGDAFRTFGLRHRGVSAFWLNCNRGKRSVQIDLNDAAGRETFLQLVAEADVCIQSFRPGVAEKLGIGDDVLAGVNRRLVRLVITGVGASGPRGSEPVFDGLVQAMSGLAAAQGGDNAPKTVAAMVFDKVTAAMAAQAGLVGLFERTKTGIGRRIDVAMLDVAAYWNFPDLFQDRTFLEDHRRLGASRSPVVATADGHIAIVAASGKQIGRLVDALGHPEWKGQLKRISDPTELLATLLGLVETVTQTMASAVVLERLREADVPTAPVLDCDQHLADPQVVHNAIYDVAVDARVGEVRVARYPALVDGAPQIAAFTIPELGLTAGEVLASWSPCSEEPTGDT